MYRIAICDDEPLFVEHLKLKIKKFMPASDISGFYSGVELLKEKTAFDIYFLDIQMEYINGIEAAKELRKNNADAVIIFITAVKDYVFDAFDVSAMQYLLKPVDDIKLKETLERAVHHLNKNHDANDKKLVVKSEGRSITLNLADIYYFENDIRKIIAHTKNGNIVFYGVMSEMEKQAGDDFYRCHRGYLVNMAYIKEYGKDELCVENGDKLYISKERYGNFVKQYMRHIRGGDFLDE